MMETVLGILCGLVAAFLQSCSYLVSGSYVKRTGLPGWTLSGPQQIVMIIPYAILAYLAMPDDLPAHWREYVVPTCLCMVFAYSGNSGLFQFQRSVEPSRTGPLQAVKVPILALMMFLFRGSTYSIQQIFGIALVIVAAFTLAGAGKRIPFSGWFWLLVCTSCYASSDMEIGTLLKSTRPLCTNVVQSSFFVLGLTHVATGLLAIPILAVQRISGSPIPRASYWVRYAMGYGFVWLAAMLFLFVCFSISGMVLGTIVQSSRGLISVLIGWAIARSGKSILEEKVPRALLLRRIAAAVFIILAMVLYSCK